MLHMRSLIVPVLIAGILPAPAAFRGAHYKVRRSAARAKSEKAAATSALEFVVTADEPFPARALDPVLHVGEVEVRDYRYVDMENKTLIFTCPDPDKLEDGAPVYLQYENDVSTRTDMPAFRRSMVTE